MSVVLGDWNRLALGIVIGAVLATGGSWLLRRPSNYDDCVLDALKGNRTDAATAAIVDACTSKFSEGLALPDQPLDPEQIARITGRAGVTFGSTFSGNLYNGNPDVTVTTVEVRVTATSRSDTTSRVFRQPVAIGPLGTFPLTVNIIEGEPGSIYSWSIAAARGRPISR